MSWLSEVGSFISKNSDVLKAGAAGLQSIAGHRNDANTANNLTDLYRQNEQYNYDQGKAAYDAQLAYNQKYDNWAASSAAASRANAAARAAAAAQTEKNRQNAAKKGGKIAAKGTADALALYKPYVDAGTAILPGMTKTYQGGLDNLAMLSAYLTSPDQMKKAAGSIPAWQQNIPLPRGTAIGGQ